MTSDPSVDHYLAELPDDRRDAITRVRNAVNASLPTGYEEVVAGGAIRWVVPLGRYPDTVDGEPLVLASVASRKHHMTFDLGGTSTRFKRLHDLDLHAAGREIAGTTVEDLIERYETSNPESRSSRSMMVTLALLPEATATGSVRAAR